MMYSVFKGHKKEEMNMELEKEKQEIKDLTELILELSEQERKDLLKGLKLGKAIFKNSSSKEISA